MPSSYYKDCTILVDGKQCIIWEGACTASGYGRKRITWPSGEKCIEKTHRLAYMMYNKILKYDLPKRNEFNIQMDISHLCNNRKCLNVSHLVYEAHNENMDRMSCFRTGHCSRNHHPYCIA